MIREANTDMLGKLVWDIPRDADKLWVQLFKNKYVDNNFVLYIPKKLAQLFGIRL